MWQCLNCDERSDDAFETQALHAGLVLPCEFAAGDVFLAIGYYLKRADREPRW